MVFQLFFFEQCSPIMEVNDIHSWHHDSRVTDDSDCESENDLRYIVPSSGYYYSTGF